MFFLWSGTSALKMKVIHVIIDLLGWPPETCPHRASVLCVFYPFWCVHKEIESHPHHQPKEAEDRLKFHFQGEQCLSFKLTSDWFDHKMIPFFPKTVRLLSATNKTIMEVCL